MSITITREEVTTLNFVEQRKARVAEIRSSHSEKLFGHPNASIGEIRTEAIKRRLETIFNK